MADLHSALSALKQRAESGQAVAQWEIDNLRKYFAVFEHSVHHHHDAEEQIFFPFVETKAKVNPPPTHTHTHSWSFRLVVA